MSSLDALGFLHADGSWRRQNLAEMELGQDAFFADATLPKNLPLRLLCDITKKTPTFFGCPKGNFLYHFLNHLCPLLWQRFAVRMASNRQHILVIEMPTNSHRLSAADTAT